MPRASIIIPHYNGQQHLETCLGSLRRQTVSDFEVLLVDNGSTDGSQAYLRAEFPEVRLIELGRNFGFTGACNAGFAAATSPILILLNNDTETDPHWLANILDGFARHPEVGSIASRMMLFDRRDHFHTAGDFVRLDGTPGNRGVWQKDEGQYDREETVFSACGGAAAYRREVLEHVGYLDDAYFFSCEDVDLGWRINLAGWRVLYLPTAIVYHKLKATGGSVTGSYYDGRNFLYLIAKNMPSSLLRRHWRMILRGQWRITREALRHWRGEAARARLRGQLAGLFKLPTLWGKRRQVQQHRRLDDDSLITRLTPVDETE
ncbi:MAG: glycosyltransferase family 2 protein [Chloroflexi bacterium]|nr:glycosyltransferase family 2 protein [Chloroflexota bacterium]MBP8056695.1 glycosyltransferase family 2 protein [Chloroflexota bacterium]